MMNNFEIINENSFPKIYTHSNLKYSSNLKISIEEIYPNLKKPSHPSRLKNKDNELQLLFGGIGCGIFTFIGLGLLCLLFTNIFLNISSDDWQKYWYPTILIISITAGIIVLILGVISKVDENIANDKNYEESLKTYTERLNKYNEILKKVNSVTFQYKEKIKRNNIELASTKKYIFESLQILDDSSIKKGITEEFFYKYLKKYSDFTIYKSIKHSFYYPDLILVKNNLVIDLEIDEPYSFDSKEPIHLDNYDKERNQLFLRSGYVIIRFSEEQIITSPNNCLIVIEEILDSCLTLKEYNKSSAFLDIESSAWSYEDAFNMAYKGTRNDVLNRINRLQLEHNL